MLILQKPLGKILSCLLALQMIIVLPSCADSAKTEPDRMINLKVSKQTPEGAIPVGTIKFDSGNQGVLDLLRTDEFGKQLELAWQEIRKQKEIPMTEGHIIDHEGEKTLAHGERMVTPNDEEFPWAVYDYLEMEYGFSVDAEY